MFRFQHARHTSVCKLMGEKSETNKGIFVAGVHYRPPDKDGVLMKSSSAPGNLMLLGPDSGR